MGNLKITHHYPKDFGQNTDLSEKSSDKISDKSDSAERWHIDVWADRYYPLIDQLFIVLKGRGIPKWKVIIDALEFYRAFQSGDPVRALEKRGDLLALLAPLSEKSSDKPLSLSLLDQDPIQEVDLEKEKRISELSEALARVCRKNLRIPSHLEKVEPLAVTLEAAGKTPADLDLWLAQVWPNDYRYQPSKAPGLHIVEATIEEAQPTPTPEQNPQTSTTPAVATGAESADLDRILERYNPPPEPIVPDGCRRHQDMWIASLNQLQIQLNRSTYDTWLRRIRLVEIQPGPVNVFLCSTSNPYAKDWVERHLLTRWEKSLTDFLRKPAQIQIQIEES